MTGGQLGILYWLIKADSKEFDSSLKGTEKTAEKANKNVGDSFKNLAAGVLVAKAVFDKVVAVVGELISAYAVQEQAEKRLEAVIKATGNAAGFTSWEMRDMASELQRATLYGDEMVLGAQAILATFKSISGDIFPRTIEAAADLSAVFGQSLSQSTTMLGKALEDPITGMGAMKRVGVTLSEQTQKLVKDFVELGDVESAQNEILKAVEGQVKGAAKAMADTSTGALQQLTNAFGDLKEQMGKGIADGIKPYAQGLTGIVNLLTASMQKAEETQNQTTVDIVKNTYKATGELSDFLQGQLESVGRVGQVIGGKLVVFTKDSLEKSKQLLDSYYAGFAKKQAEWERKRDEDREKEKERQEAVAAIREEYAKKYFELKATDIQLLERERDEAIAKANEIGASTYEIKKYYDALIKEEKEIERLEKEEKDAAALEAEKQRQQAMLDNRREGEKMYTEYLAEQEKERKKLKDETDKEEKKREEARIERLKKDAETTINILGDIAAATIGAAISGGDAWEAFKKASLQAIASLVRGLGKQFAIQAAGYLSNPLTAGIGVAYGAAAVAAYTAAAVIPSLDTGGMLKQDSLIQAHKDEIVMPLDKSIDLLADKLNQKGAGGDIYLTINVGSLNNEMDVDRVFREGALILQQTQRSF